MSVVPCVKYFNRVVVVDFKAYHNICTTSSTTSMCGI